MTFKEERKRRNIKHTVKQKYEFSWKSFSVTIRSLSANVSLLHETIPRDPQKQKYKEIKSITLLSTFVDRQQHNNRIFHTPSMFSLHFPQESQENESPFKGLRGCWKILDVLKRSTPELKSFLFTLKKNVFRRTQNEHREKEEEINEMNKALKGLKEKFLEWYETKDYKHTLKYSDEINK
ncbi:CLUMA_CG010088, isoform A [Clunio marinus]|uniref:CLUMA_CG010088, isoform A n=1 Tax=Clunio marinus TaxID=568069 RepID=A0A1J1I8U9_9DIPT|nr:CLUMA_CG010088, isoform A [Clunio marinus]